MTRIIEYSPSDYTIYKLLDIFIVYSICTTQCTTHWQRQTMKNYFTFIGFLLSLIKPRGQDVLSDVMSECQMFKYHFPRQEHPAGEEDDPGQGDLRPRLPVLHPHVGSEAGPALPPHLPHWGHQHQQRVHSEDAELQVRS